MKATIHFTEDGGAYIFTGDDPEAGFITTHPSHITNTRADLEKLRLEAVIQKEAEEKYPYKELKYFGGDEKMLKAYNWDSYKFRKEHIGWWQSLIERLPSEDIKESSYKKFPIDDFGDDIKQDIDAERRTIWIEAATWAKSMYLPSLPSTLSCEYEEENGKVTVTKLTLK